MNDIGLDRYLTDDALRRALLADARRERAQAVQALLVAAARYLVRLPGRLWRYLAALRPANGTEPRTRPSH